MKKKTVIILTVVFLVIAGIVAGVIAMKSSIEASLEGLANEVIEDVDLSKVEDGTYSGSFETMPVAVTVKVTVKDHKILDIVLVKHNNGQGKAAESIPQAVIKAQSLKVDTVSGATYSSKAILKAIQNVLNGGNS